MRDFDLEFYVIAASVISGLAVCLAFVEAPCMFIGEC